MTFTQPIFLLQKEPNPISLSHECMSVMVVTDKVRTISIQDIHTLNPELKFQYIPVGTVEFIREYCHHMGLYLSENSISYEFGVLNYVKRKIRGGKFSDALPNEFVKPVGIKNFTGGIKSEIQEEIDPDSMVWISEPVPFDCEYRFYIQNHINGPEIIGYARYDDKDTPPIYPDEQLVMNIARHIHSSIGPNGYSIDIGWRSDIREFDLVELNDGWALGYYTNSDSPNRPSVSQYTQLLYSRWLQILFYNLIP